MVRVAAFFICVVLLALTAAPPADAQGRIVGRHGDWQIRCERQVGAPSEQCALVQNVEAQDRANVGLTVIFLLTADRQARILRVLAPLGLLLPQGLGLSIDGNEVGAAGFVRCLPEGCIAEVELEDGLIERFEAGRTATFVIFQTPEEGIGIPISLNGFTDGFQALYSPPPAGSVPDEPVPPQAVTTAAQAPSAPSADRFAAISEELDTRTELDRLLEDDLFIYVVAAFLILVVLIVIASTLVMRRVGPSKRRRAADDAEEMASDEEADDMPPARVPPRLAGPQSDDDPGDDGGPRAIAAPQRPRN